METEKLDLLKDFLLIDETDSKEFFLDLDCKLETDVFGFGIRSLRSLWELIEDDLSFSQKQEVLTNLFIAYRTMDFFHTGEDLEEEDY